MSRVSLFLFFKPRRRFNNRRIVSQYTSLLRRRYGPIVNNNPQVCGKTNATHTRTLQCNIIIIIIIITATATTTTTNNNDPSATKDCCGWLLCLCVCIPLYHFLFGVLFYSIFCNFYTSFTFFRITYTIPPLCSLILLYHILVTYLPPQLPSTR